MVTSQIFLTIFAVLLALYGLFWLLGVRHNRRRGRLFLMAFNDSTGATMAVHFGPDARGFVAYFEPAPAPYVYLAVLFRPSPPQTYWLRPLLLRRDRLYLRGILTEPPRNELIWTRGRIPDRAAGHGPRAQLWQRKVHHTTNVEFELRGSNCGALENGFRALHMRFSPLLLRVNLLGDAAIERRLRNLHAVDARNTPVDLQLDLTAAKLPAEEIAALVAQARALGRAALLG
ncbi:MAG: hypothetical protein KDE47_08710 [Caldilineaceae bacterium]|nr:hypothetical protein [Caldilineaceae bacterium]